MKRAISMTDALRVVAKACKRGEWVCVMIQRTDRPGQRVKFKAYLMPRADATMDVETFNPGGAPVETSFRATMRGTPHVVAEV